MLIPVLINYLVGNKRYEKEPDSFDFELINKIENMDIPYWFPTGSMPEGYNTEQPKRSHGITHAHHFYTKRNLWVLGAIADKSTIDQWLIFQSIVSTLCSRLVRYNIV